MLLAVNPCISAAEPLPEAPSSALSASDAVVLGLVEGISEFLPISSTGHLIIANRALGLDAEAPLTDAAGAPLWLERPSDDSAGVPLTLKSAADTYIVAIQLGAILAVVLLYWKHLTGILLGLTGRNSAGLRLLRNLLLAFLPVVVVGLALSDLIDEHLFSVTTVIAALAAGAFLMIGAERWRRFNEGPAISKKEPSDLSARESLMIGFMQCLALWPGMSRSMVTMVGGYFAGLSPARSADFSFLVGLPVLGGAAVYKLWKTGPALLMVFGWSEMIIGGLVAMVSAAIAIKFLISYLGRHGLGVFAIYRLVLAAVLGIWFFV